MRVKWFPTGTRKQIVGTLMVLPAKNPELWEGNLMKAVFAKTCAGGTAATYTAQDLSVDTRQMRVLK